jgi:hypothetical protein
MRSGAVPAGGAADRRRGEEMRHPEDVPRPRAEAARKHADGPSPVPPSEQRVAVQSGDDRASAGVFEHRHDEVGIGRVARAVPLQDLACDRADDVECVVAVVEPDPVGYADVRDRALLPVVLQCGGRVWEALRQGHRGVEPLAARYRRGEREQRARVAAATERDHTRGPQERTGKRTFDLRARIVVPRLEEDGLTGLEQLSSGDLQPRQPDVAVALGRM